MTKKPKTLIDGDFLLYVLTDMTLNIDESRKEEKKLLEDLICFIKNNCIIKGEEDEQTERK